MPRLLAVTITALLAAIVSAQNTDVVQCGPGLKCPEDLPCCSQYNQCGTGAYCLGGCNPLESFSLESCVPEPVCKSQDFKLTSLDGIEPNTKYLGDSSKANWVSSGKAAPFEDSLLLTMAPDSVGTVLASTSLVWYGQVSATLKTSRGRGVVTAFILLSDVKDEIDFEFVGTDLTTAQSNYYFQGITNYNNGLNISLSDTFDTWHTYAIDWTPEQITWSIDGQVGRTIKKSDTWNTTANRYYYPQTPARVQLSIWPGGLASNGEGTINWAGGLVDWSNHEDITNNGYYYAQVKDVSIQCYDAPANAKRSGSKSYIYTDEAGTEDTVEITDKPTILKSLLGTGTNMSADYPSPSASKSESKTSASAEASSAAATSAESDANTDRQIPGLTGAGPGSGGQRDAPQAQDSNSDSDSADSSDSSGSSSTGSSNSSPSQRADGFVQGPASGAQGNGATGQGDNALQGSVFAGLVALAGMLLL